MTYELIENILSPIDNNIYVKGVLLVLLIISAGYFIPHPLFPKNTVNLINQYVAIPFLLTLLLAYLLTNNINVSLVAAVLIFVLSYITRRTETFDSPEYVNLLVNKYNAELDKEEHPTNEIKSVVQKEPEVIIEKVEDNFDFSADNLKYLTYDSKKLNKFQEDVLNDQFTGNQVQPF